MSKTVAHDSVKKTELEKPREFWVEDKILGNNGNLNISWGNVYFVKQGFVETVHVIEYEPVMKQLKEKDEKIKLLTEALKHIKLSGYSDHVKFRLIADEALKAVKGEM